MPLGTKGNSLIVKDGKLAENCGCCGTWYCCEDKIGTCRDRLNEVLKITATISAQDYKKHDLVSGCQCDVNGPVWTSGTYLWPGSKYAGTFELTGRRNPPQFGIEYGQNWIFEYAYSSDGAGCTGANLAVEVNVRVPGDLFQTTDSTRLQIGGLALNGNFYRYFKSSNGTPSPETKDLQDMKCVTTATGPVRVCEGGVREVYTIGPDPILLFNQRVYNGLCAIESPIQINGIPFSAGSLGKTGCGSSDSFGTEQYSLISETGSRMVSGSLLIEQL